MKRNNNNNNLTIAWQKNHKDRSFQKISGCNTQSRTKHIRPVRQPSILGCRLTVLTHAV